MIDSLNLKQIEEKLEAMFILQDGIDEIILALREKQKNLKSDELKPILDNLTPESFMSINDWNNINQNTYRQLKKWVETNYSKGFRASGYNPITGQTGLEVMFNQNIPFEDQLDILHFIPYLMSSKDDRYKSSKDECYIKIFEHTLSERYSYSLRSNKDKSKWWVQNHIGHIYFSSSDVKDALKYIYNSMPYIKLGYKD